MNRPAAYAVSPFAAWPPAAHAAGSRGFLEAAGLRPAGRLT